MGNTIFIRNKRVCIRPLRSQIKAIQKLEPPTIIQTRSKAKSSGIKLLEIHGVNKGLNPHVNLGRQRPLSTLPMHSISPTLLVQPFDKGQPTHPIPKPRIGQGRAGLRRKFKTDDPIPLPKQTPAEPIRTHVPKAAPSLPDPVAQSKESL